MNFYSRVYKMTKRIPRGRVATYGQIAALCGSPRAARQVGWALHALDEKPNHASVSWQRVINRHGMISTTCIDHPADEQAFLLRREGVRVTKREGNFFVDLKEYIWKQKESRWQ
ncbi:MAG: MGMT family protein [Patescibacteria group bacterium]|jgi:methylated-DNA-protein-cysteine methyltransferase-like protein